LELELWLRSGWRRDVPSLRVLVLARMNTHYSYQLRDELVIDGSEVEPLQSRHRPRAVTGVARLVWGRGGGAA
jgi:hypothetical protein